MYHDSPEFARFVQEEIEKWKVTGLSVAVIQGGKIHTKVSRPYTCFAFHRRWKDKEMEEDAEIKPEFTRPVSPEPLDLPLEALTGRYHDVGYKDLVLEMKDGKLIAACDDRCFPFVLTFIHLTANKFLVENCGTMDGVVRKRRGEVRIEGNKATSIGVEFEEYVKGGLIWFKRTG